MQTENPRTINEHFDRKYGPRGSKEREAFQERAQAYMIAELVKDARAMAHLTQQQLADRLEVNRAYISKIERGVGDVRVSTLKRIVEQGLGGKLHIRVEL
ncbi:helix-turn-helix transcriptional regulator [soil metagenome]